MRSSSPRSSKSSRVDERRVDGDRYDAAALERLFDLELDDEELPDAPPQWPSDHEPVGTPAAPASRRARVGKAIVRVGGGSIPASGQPMTASETVLEYATGPCSSQSTLSCGSQSAIVLGITAVSGIAVGLLSGSLLGAALGLVVGNLVGRKAKTTAPSTGAACLSTEARRALVGRIASKEISVDDAAKMQKSYELSGCTEDAQAIRITIAAVQSGDLVMHTAPKDDGFLMSAFEPPAVLFGGGALPDALSAALQSYFDTHKHPPADGAIDRTQREPTLQDFYRLQQVALRYPSIGYALDAYIQSWNSSYPRYTARALDDAISVADLTAYFKAQSVFASLFPTETSSTSDTSSPADGPADFGVSMRWST